MNMVDARFRGWYYGAEATEYLSREVGRPIDPETVFVAAIRPKGVPVFLHVPPTTKDKRGEILDEGLWELVTERTDQGRPARQHLSWVINNQTSLESLTGAFVRRRGDKQSPRELNPYVSHRKAWGAWPKGCELAFKEEDLDRLASMLKTETPPSAPKSADALDKDLDPRERNSLMYIIAGLVHELDGTRSEVDLEQTSKGAGQIEAMTERIGHRVSARAAVEKLKEIEKLLPKK